MPIKMLNARQIFDSTGIPTVEVDMVTELGLFRIGVPSTDVKKNAEAVQMRDNNPKVLLGMGVTVAVKSINNIIAVELIKQNLEVTMQREIDQFLMDLDGTENKSRLGGNAILAVSLVVAKAGAAKKGMPLYRHISDMAGVSTIIMPVPHITLLMGGLLSSNMLPFQEYSIMPTGASSFCEAIRMGQEIYQYIKNSIKIKYGMDKTYVSDIGGFSIPFDTTRLPLCLIAEAIKNCGYSGKVDMAINAAATDLYKDGAYDVDIKNPNSSPQDYVSSEKLSETYLDYFKEFSCVSIEDPFELDHWSAWSQLGTRIPPNFQLVGDDLTQTNLQRIGLAVEKKACQTVALKLNQAGTVTELIDGYKLLKANGICSMVSDRWGDTDDLFLADLAVGLSCGQVKCGGMARGERIGKYNQIIRIEEELGALAKYAGKNFREL